ncbi:hypothetical protein ATK74_0805 [Propionicimonas paludicola]|uniref:Phage protein D n=1 Tax=Propionicimonas paludicola TaxID=185243 RepID=A0A2A9CQ02_9ACTN|nr:hypothetical protein ATK74_0805 [Propionicimonas paludicola]
MIWLARLNGDGTETGLRTEVPATSCPIVDPLTAPQQITLTLEPESIDVGLFVPWQTAVYVGTEDQILAAGIVDINGVTSENSKLTVKCVGWSGYIAGMPWTDKALSYVHTDPGKILRAMWLQVQSHHAGNIGLSVPAVSTGTTVGTPAVYGKTKRGKKTVKTAAEPFVLASYATADLAAAQTTLLTEGKIEYRERHWVEGGVVKHALLMASPRLGRRNPDVRLVIGENVTEVPSVDPAQYASEVLVLGAGDGPKKIQSRQLIAAPPRLRRVYLHNQETITRSAAAERLAKSLLKLLAGTADDVEKVVVTDGPSARIGALVPGDEVLLSGDSGWAGPIEVWVRILEREWDEVAPQTVTLTVARADKVGE